MVSKAYQAIRFRAGDSWRIAREGELLGRLEKLDGVWQARGKVELPDQLVAGICKLIDAQHFNRLPAEVKKHWPAQIQEVIPSGDAEYLVIAKPGINFERFVRIFTVYIPHLIKDEWPILFKLYNAEMTEDMELTARRMKK